MWEQSCQRRGWAACHVCEGGDRVGLSGRERGSMREGMRQLKFWVAVYRGVLSKN